MEAYTGCATLMGYGDRIFVNKVIESSTATILCQFSYFLNRTAEQMTKCFVKILDGCCDIKKLCLQNFLTLENLLLKIVVLHTAI